MLSPKTIFLALLGLNLVAVFLISLNTFHVRFEQKALTTMNLKEIEGINSTPMNSEEIEDLNLTTTNPDETEALNLTAASKITKSPYMFENPYKALYLLETLDIFETVGPKQLVGANYKDKAGGLKANNKYCEEHRAYFVQNPEFIFNEQNFISNYWFNHKLRTQTIPKLGTDLHPEIYPRTNKAPPSSDMKINANMFFMYNLFFQYRQLGVQFSCLSQASNHIPGHQMMDRKDKIGQALVTYAKKYSTRQECFNYNKYFPKTWVLQQKAQCLDFFKEFNSPRYQQLKKERNIVYFRKIGAGVHEGKGVFPVSTEEELKIRTLYKNGTLCGKVKANNLIQYNVYNSLLVQNRKPGFRVFLLIASANPVIAYYHDGYMRLSINEYNQNSKEAKTFVTNIGTNLREATKESAFAGMTAQEINEVTAWSYEKFYQYLVEEGRVTDPNWLDNYLRAEFKKVFIHLIRMAQGQFFQKSSVYELFGVDFVMDDDLNVWFIEANSMPLVNGFTKDSTVLMNRMLEDTFEIVFGLLRSRMKRVINYINNLTRETTTLNIHDIVMKRQVFKKLTKNYFEPEFMPSSNNTFQIIIDENKLGVNRYSGLIEKECL